MHSSRHAFHRLATILTLQQQPTGFLEHFLVQTNGLLRVKILPQLSRLHVAKLDDVKVIEENSALGRFLSTAERLAVEKSVARALVCSLADRKRREGASMPWRFAFSRDCNDAAL